MFSQKLFSKNITATTLRDDNDELSFILSDYQKYFESDPAILRKSIPVLEVWRFFVEGRRQCEGWLPFEEVEPNYFKALFNAFHSIFDVTKPLSIDYIKCLHKMAALNVGNTNYCRIRYQKGIGEFRGEDQRRGGCSIYKNTVTQKGLLQLLSMNSPSCPAISLCYSDFRGQKSVIHFSMSTVEKLRAHREVLANPDVIEFEALREIASEVGEVAYLRHLNHEHHLRIIARLFSRVSKISSNKELSKLIFELIECREYIDNNFEWMSFSQQAKGSVNVCLEAEMETLISLYHQSIQLAKAPSDKLIAIINLIQKSEQLHPFSDCNCRVFCMLLLNHLLIKNGFPLVIMEDPNTFDCYSLPQMFVAVMNGMRNTVQLALSGSKPFFGFKTDLNIEWMKQNNPSQYEYFQQLTAVEYENRIGFKWDFENFYIKL